MKRTIRWTSSLLHIVFFYAQFALPAVTYFGGQPRPMYPAYAPPQPMYPPMHHGYGLDIDPPDYPYFGPPVHYARPPPMMYAPQPVMMAQPQQYAQQPMVAGQPRQAAVQTVVAQPKVARVATHTVTKKPGGLVQIGNTQTGQVQTLRIAPPVQMRPMQQPVMAQYPQPMASMYGGYMGGYNSMREMYEGRPCGPPSTPSPQYKAMQREALASNGNFPEHEASFECDCRQRRSCKQPDMIKPQHQSYCGGAKQTQAMFNQYVCCCQYSMATQQQLA